VIVTDLHGRQSLLWGKANVGVLLGMSQPMMHADCISLDSQCHAQDQTQCCSSTPPSHRPRVCAVGGCVVGRGGGKGLAPSLRPCQFVCMRHDGLCQHHRCHVVKIAACPQRLKQLRQPVHSGRETTRTRATNTPPVQRGEIFISGSR